MPNPSGKNSPESFDEFAPKQGYGSQQRGNRLREQAPLAGEENSTHALQTARRATEIATKSAGKQIKARQKARAQAQQEEPVLPPQPPVSAGGNQYDEIWQEVANTPGASELVKQYASGT